MKIALCCYAACYIVRQTATQPEVALQCLDVRGGLWAAVGRNLWVNESPGEALPRIVAAETGYSWDQVVMIEPVLTPVVIANDGEIDPAGGTCDQPKAWGDYTTNHGNVRVSPYVMTVAGDPVGSDRVRWFTADKLASLTRHYCVRESYRVLDGVFARREVIQFAQFALQIAGSRPADRRLVSPSLPGTAGTV